MLHIIFAIIINILLALYAKSIFDKKIAERKLKNEQEARMREEGQNEELNVQAEDGAFNFELKSNTSRRSNYNPNALNDSRMRRNSKMSRNS